VEYKIFADYFQFFLQDENAIVDLSDSWTEESHRNRIVVSDGIVAIRTSRNMNVPVEIEIVKNKPDIVQTEWEVISECSINVSSNKLVLMGCTDYFPEATRIQIEPGLYGVFALYNNLSDLSDDGLDGNDVYKLVLWPEKTVIPLSLIKKSIHE